MQQTKDSRAGCLPLAWGGVILGGMIVAWLLVATVSRAPAPPPDPPLVMFAGELLSVALRLFPVAVLSALGIAAWRWATRAGAERLQDGLLRVAELRAVHQTPQPHVFSPRIELEYGGDRPALPAALDALPTLPQVVPTFAELLSGGQVGPGRPLLLGMERDGGAAVTGSWLDLYSTIISGLPGSGKTTTQRFLAAQTAMAGARFVVVDPHAGAAEDSLAATLDPLSGVYLCQPASTDTAILAAVQLVDDIGHRRVTGKDTSRDPIILWLDETTSLLSRSSVAAPLAELIEQIAQEYRKVGVYCSASGQIWPASRSGGDSALRDSFASVLSHRMKRAQARLLLPTEDAAQAERLEVGQAVLYRTSGESVVIQVPQTTAADVRRVAGMLHGTSMVRATTGSTPVAGATPYQVRTISVPSVETVPTALISAESRRAAAMFLDGSDMAEIVWALRQVPSTGKGSGGNYTKAAAEVWALIREGLKEQGAAS